MGSDARKLRTDALSGSTAADRRSVTCVAGQAIRIGPATVTYTQEGCFTSYDDGTSYGAHPHDTHHYYVIAHRCGYGDDVLAYAREHEACHHIVGHWIKQGGSDVIGPLAHGVQPDPVKAVMEEAMTMIFQRWLRANERPIIGGVDWDGLKVRALTLLGN